MPLDILPEHGDWDGYSSLSAEKKVEADQKGTQTRVLGVFKDIQELLDSFSGWGLEILLLCEKILLLKPVVTSASGFLPA